MKKNIFRTIAMVLTFMLMISSFAFAAETKTEVKTETKTDSTETKTDTTKVTPPAVDAEVNAKIPADVQGKPYAAAVTALIEKGIIKGYADGTFKPDNNLTRAEACVIVVKTMNAPDIDIVGTSTQKPPKSGFADMGAHSWADPYVAYAVKMGVVTGYEDKTFKPARQVSCDEFMAMIVNAAGHKEKAASAGAWPTNYQKVGTELSFYKELSEINQLPKYAPRWIAAQMDFNAMEAIEKKAAEKPETKPEEKPEGVPSTAGMTFSMTGSFDSNISTYSGKPLGTDVKVYTYAKKKDYKNGMTMSEKKEDYVVDVVSKFKGAQTPAFYKIEDGKITEMILPRDTGFTGLVYGVINSISQTANADNESVTAFKALTAGKEITWVAKKGVTFSDPTSVYLAGECYELYAVDGQITRIAKTTDPSKKGVVFKELTSSPVLEVESKQAGSITFVDGNVVGVKSNATVYILNEDGKSYEVGSFRDVTKGGKVRLFDISDDDEGAADFIVIVK